METTLYKITEQQRYLLEEIEMMQGELTPEMEEQLVIQAHQLESKAEGYLSIITQKEDYINRIDAEIKRLQQLKKVNNNFVTRLKENLLQAVKTFGDFEVGLTTFSTRKSQSITVEDVNSLKTMYKTIKVTETPNKMALKNALKSGVEIQGVELVDKLNLKIN